ncbi:MAG: TlpA disulfide reductase family protein [Trueperaceae bacterium]
MDAVRIGFFVISAPRLYAAVGLLFLVVVAELGAWLRRRSASAVPDASGEVTDASWAWNALFAVIIGARLGFVVQNMGYYITQPLQALAFWQGGFAPWWGVAAGALVAFLSLRRRRRSLGVTVLPAAFALGAWLLVPQLLSPAGGAPVAFPSGVVERLEGDAFDFGDHAGRPTVVNVWASWCIPCRRELPQLARAAEEHPEVLILYVNQGESRETVAAFLAGFPTVDAGNVLLDRSQRVGNQLRSVGLPSTYFFDANGNHVKTHVGEISGPAITRELHSLAAVR